MGARGLSLFESEPPNLSTKPLWISLGLRFGVDVNSVRLGAVGFGTGIRFGAVRFGAVGFPPLPGHRQDRTTILRFFL